MGRRSSGTRCVEGLRHHFPRRGCTRPRSTAIASHQEAKITFGRGARHLVQTGLDQGEVETAIQSQVGESVSGASSNGAFWGRVTVNGQTVEYTVIFAGVTGGLTAICAAAAPEAPVVIPSCVALAGGGAAATSLAAAEAYNQFGQAFSGGGGGTPGGDGGGPNTGDTSSLCSLFPGAYLPLDPFLHLPGPASPDQSRSLPTSQIVP